MVWGIVTSEAPDHDKEICDYPAAKAAIQKWSDDTLAKTTAAGQDPSLGNMRVMHQLQIGGKAIKIEYRDDSKQVWVGSEPADENVWHLLKGGFLTAHSIGGNYAWKKADGDYTRYAPTINEISYVDKGSNPEATFAYVKADGTTELRKFAKPGPEEEKLLAKLQASEITKLSDEDVDRIAKTLAVSLDTRLDKISELFDEIMSQRVSTGATMKPEDVTKCAKALGITEEEFKKQIGAGEMQKAKGLAALHEHLKSAHEEHGAMSKAHDKMGTHIEKCMKACSSVMGSDEKESEKAMKALIDELRPAVTETPEVKKAREDAEEVARKAAAAKGAEGTFTKAEVETMIKASTEALEKKFAEQPAPDPKGLRLIPRDGVEKAAKSTADTNASPY